MIDSLKPNAAPRLSRLKRGENIDRMRGETFDLAVIGGGITGAGIALDARSRGLSVALVEKGDFASGTSSRSSKLIHGGLRYLEHLEFSLVREALRERETLSRIAPHLSRPLAFLVPLYNRGLPSPLGSNKLKLRLGLTLYDFLAGSRNVGCHRWLAPGEALKLAPALASRGLRGAFLYYDCLTDDARLVIEVIKAAAAMGAAVANYAAARDITRLNDSSYRIEVEDIAANRAVTLRASAVINATGVWADSVARLSDAAAPRRLRPSKGIHVVVPSEKLNNQAAVLIPSVGEQRFLFVIPWLGRTLIGTTDTDYDGELDDPAATREEAARIFESAARMFPGANLSESDCISAFAGLRPLVGGNQSATANISRKEELFESESGMITIIGGKLTTYRRMAERAVDLAALKLESKSRRAKRIMRHRMKRRSLTEQIELAGGRLERDVRAEAEQAALHYGVSVNTAIHLVETYGRNFREVLEIAGESEELRNRLAADLPHIEAEVIYAARAEMAVTVEDFLSRRTRIALVAPDHGRRCAARVATLMARELGWSSSEAQEALAGLSL